MAKYTNRKARRENQRKAGKRLLARKTYKTLAMNVLVCLSIMAAYLIYNPCQLYTANTANTYEIKETEKETELEPIKQEIVITQEQPKQETDKVYSEEEIYMLAKIVMSEVGSCSFKSKVVVALAVLNRVNDASFPDTIKEVIFEENNGVYAFSPVMPGGMWYVTEPNKDCYEAVKTALSLENDEDNISKGATSFESCQNPDNWHSRNLEFLFELDGVRYYK